MNALRLIIWRQNCPTRHSALLIWSSKERWQAEIYVFLKKYQQVEKLSFITGWYWTGRVDSKQRRGTPWVRTVNCCITEQGFDLGKMRTFNNMFISFLPTCFSFLNATDDKGKTLLIPYIAMPLLIE